MLTRLKSAVDACSFWPGHCVAGRCRNCTVNGKIFENPGRLLSCDSAQRGINRQRRKSLHRIGCCTHVVSAAQQKK